MCVCLFVVWGGVNWRGRGTWCIYGVAAGQLLYWNVPAATALVCIRMSWCLPTEHDQVTRDK